jgi:hypothetical protein
MKPEKLAPLFETASCQAASGSQAGSGLALTQYYGAPPKVAKNVKRQYAQVRHEA